MNEPNWNKSRSQTFRRMIMKDERGNHQVVEVADYEEYMNARPDSMPREAEIKVQDTDSLKSMLRNSDSFRKTVASVAANASRGKFSQEDADRLLLEISSKANQDAAKKRGLVQRFLNLFGR